MKITKKQIQELNQTLLANYIGKKVKISFKEFSFECVLGGMKYYRLTDLKVNIEKREKDGKMYTPQVIALEFPDVGDLLFVYEDLTITQGLDKLFFEYGAGKVVMELLP